MAFRLAEYVVYGELWNTHHYSTTGMIALRGDVEGEETVIRLELTGDCGPDLHGKHVRFWPSEDEPEKLVFHAEEFPRFQAQQIGPTGTMTAQGWVRMLPCPIEEFLRRVDLGEPPPTPWRRHLYLEWYSQNGRTVIEMADPLVEECVREPRPNDEADEGEWTVLPNDAPCPDESAPRPTSGPDITMIRIDGDGEAHVEHLDPVGDIDAEDEADASIPGALQHDLDAEAAAIERMIAGESDDSDPFMREMELMDDCIENRDGTPLTTLLGNLGQLPQADDLDDEEVEVRLKGLLMRLAYLNVTLDVCEHCTPRDSYKLLTEKILPDSTAFEEMIGTGWIQHVATFDYCAQCEAECQAEFEGKELPPPSPN